MMSVIRSNTYTELLMFGDPCKSPEINNVLVPDVVSILSTTFFIKSPDAQLLTKNSSPDRNDIRDGLFVARAFVTQSATVTFNVLGEKPIVVFLLRSSSDRSASVNSKGNRYRFVWLGSSKYPITNALGG